VSDLLCVRVVICVLCICLYCEDYLRMWLFVYVCVYERVD